MIERSLIDRTLTAVAIIASSSLTVAGAMFDGVAAILLLALAGLVAFGWALLVELAHPRVARLASKPAHVLTPFVVMLRAPAADTSIPPLGVEAVLAAGEARIRCSKAAAHETRHAR